MEKIFTKLFQDWFKGGKACVKQVLSEGGCLPGRSSLFPKSFVVFKYK